MPISLERLPLSYQPVQSLCYLKTHGVVTLISELHLRIARAAAFDRVLPLVLVPVRSFPPIGGVP